MTDDAKYGRSFYPPSVNIRHDHSASRIRWYGIANANGTIEIKPLVSQGPKNFQFAIASHRAALIAAFSSFVFFALLE